MKRMSKLGVIFLMVFSLSACHEDVDDSHVLRVSFSSADVTGWSWLAASQMVLDFFNLNYSQAYLSDVHFSRSGHDYATASDVGWLLWDVGGVDNFVTGTLSFSEIRANINYGYPIILQYGDYQYGEYAVLHGYDDYGYVYLHEPFYGTRVVHYDDLFLRYLASDWLFWNASVVLID